MATRTSYTRGLFLTRSTTKRKKDVLYRRSLDRRRRFHCEAARSRLSLPSIFELFLQDEGH